MKKLFRQQQAINEYLRLIREEKKELAIQFDRLQWYELMDFDTFLAREGMWGRLGRLYTQADKWTVYKGTTDTIDTVKEVV